MSKQEIIELHAGRAMEELERARRAACPRAATAHLELSQLHLVQARMLGSAAPARPALSLVVG
jgi:hypothetical protein